MVVKRTHTAANVAPAVRTLLNQVNIAYPNRLHTIEGHDAEGIWPSAEHTAANPNSDHEAGNAIDIDDDLSGIDGTPPQVDSEFARRLSWHPACAYTIHDRRIYKHGVGSVYSGTNPHTGHVHVSVYENKRNDTTPWNIGEPPMRYYVNILVCETPEALERAKAKIASLGNPEKVVVGNTVIAHLNEDKTDIINGWVPSQPGIGNAKPVITAQDSYLAFGVRKDVPLPSCDAVAADLAKAEAIIAKVRADVG